MTAEDTSIQKAEKPRRLSKDQISEIRESLGQSAIVLSSNMQQIVNAMKGDPKRHFYKVGRYKGSDGKWHDKMEPDSFLLQTIATTQGISTEIIRAEWDNRDKFFDASYTISMRAWRGDRARPSIEKSAQLRLSMRAIAERYMIDKLSPKTEYEDGKKIKKDPEWTEEDVNILDSGWMMPKEMRKQIEMRNYLIDQYTFLDRTAETKLERRLNMKLAGFDAREPQEITAETRDVESVSGANGAAAAGKPDREYDDLLARTGRIRSKGGAEKIKKEIEARAWDSAQQRELVTALAEALQKIDEDGEEKDGENPKEEPAGADAAKEIFAEVQPATGGTLAQLFGKNK